MSTAGILTIGDELLHGDTEETNGSYLQDRLIEAGVQVQMRAILPDRIGDIITQIRLHRHLDHLLITGGIGPTHDDKTREATARAFDRSLEVHPEADDVLENQYGDDYTEHRRSMATLPAGSTAHILPEVPALAYSLENTIVFPGIPSLVEPLFEQVADRFEGTPKIKREVTLTVREADLAPLLQKFDEDYPQVDIGSYPTLGDVVRVVLRGPEEDDLKEIEERLTNEFEAA